MSMTIFNFPPKILNENNVGIVIDNGRTNAELVGHAPRSTKFTY